MNYEPTTAEFLEGAKEQRARILEFLCLLANDFREFEGENSPDAKFVEEIAKVIETDEELVVS